MVPNKFKAFLLILVTAVLFISSFDGIKPKPVREVSGDTILYPNERHFKNIQQLTFGGDNAEAYFSFDGKYLIFQHKDSREGVACDQMYIGRIPDKPGEKFEYKMISNGKGRTTC